MAYIKTTTADAYVVQEDSELQHSTNPLSITCDSCKACPICCYKALLKLNLFTDAYKSISLELPISCC